MIQILRFIPGKYTIQMPAWKLELGMASFIFMKYSLKEKKECQLVNLSLAFRKLKVIILGKTLIIAEAGVNHNASINTAKKMIDVAAEANADFVKFQTFKSNMLVTRSAEKAEYQKNLTDKAESQYEMIKNLELDQKKYAYKKIIYLKTKIN